MKRLISYLIALTFACVLVAQERETRQLSSFSEISVSEAITVELIKGNKEEAVVEADGIDLEDVITEVYRDRLEIEMRDRNRYSMNRSRRVTVYLTYREIDEINVSSAANIFSREVVAGDKLEIEVSSAGDVELEVDVNTIDASVSSAGDLELSGKAVRQFVKVSSSGDYKAFDLISEEAEIDASSSGDAEVFVTGRLEAEATSAGSVRYKGDPDKIFVDSGSGGRVRKS